MIKNDSRPGGAKFIHEIYEEGLQYIKDRRDGRIKSFKTPWIGLNDATLNGLEWGSLLTIGARPGQGKTLMVGQILRESYKQNPDQHFNILEFQFEMGPKQSASREFAAQVALDYNQVLSTKEQLSDFAVQHLEKFTKHSRELASKGVFRLQINKPCNWKQIREYVHYYYDDMGSKPLIVTIDHSWLIKQASDEKEKLNTLYNTVEMLMNLKNELPIIVMMITQLNRTLDEASRKTPGSIANYPTSSDIFGGDALMQGSDAVIAMARPGINGIKQYGPDKLPCDTNLVYLHPLKLRNSKNENELLYMRAEFSLQKLVEIPKPISTTSTAYIRRSSRNVSADIGEEL
jgi:replicative DNA helicase